MTLEELKQFCNDEFQNIERIADELSSVHGEGKSEYTLAEQASIGTFMMNIFTGYENILKQMLIYDKLEISDSPGWHEKIIRKAGEIGILPPDLQQEMAKYLAFRNYFTYSYVFNLQWDEVNAMSAAAKDVLATFRTEVEEYIQTI